MSESLARGQQLARAAACFIGARFRLHGRDPAVGLDCVGLLLCSLDAIGSKAVEPTGYRLHNSDHSPWLQCAKASGFIPARGPIEAGDVLLVIPGPGQQHLIIAESATSIIHAHAGLRKVVRQPMDQSIRPQAQWRLP